MLPLVAMVVEDRYCFYDNLLSARPYHLFVCLFVSVAVLLLPVIIGVCLLLTSLSSSARQRSCCNSTAVRWIWFL